MADLSAPNCLLRGSIAQVSFSSRLARPLRLRWDGDLEAASGPARLNRNLALGLLAAGDIDLSLGAIPRVDREIAAEDAARLAPLRARCGVPFSHPTDVTVRHQVLPDWRRPATGKLILFAPWVYGSLPREWREGALNAADEVWCPSRFARDVYVRSGVPAEKVRIVSPGFDPDLFTPDGPQYPLPTHKAVRLLFVGSTLERRGAGLLLGAYHRAFSPADDVCLVVKETPASAFTATPTLADAFRRAASDPGMPEILYLDEDLSEADLASLYRACACVVFPYRAVHYGLPVLEGMACGVPSIVTAGGPTDDFMDDATGWRLPSRRRPATGWSVGAYECVGEPWQLEPDREALVETLRHVYQHPEEARERGQAARARVQEDWTWQRAVAEVRYRLQEVVAPPGDGPFAPARLWWEPGQGSEQTESGDTSTVESNGRKRDDRKDSAPASAPPDTDPPPCASVPPCLRGDSEIELSLCMIVRDEEPRLPRCLESIAPYVDEMVVVDTGSTDRTREVAREYGARVFEFRWMDSFSLARNQSIEQARGSWIMRMDADDVITPEDGARLRELVHRYPNRNDVAYLMEYRVPPSPDGTGGHVVDQVQLWPNRPDLRFEYRLHEQLLPAVRRAGVHTVRSGLAVHHCNFDWSEEGQAKRRRRDFRLLDLDLRERPHDPFVLFNLGMTYHHTTGEHEVAVHYLRRCLEAPGGQGMARLAYPLLVSARMEQNDWKAALAVNEEGRSHYPEHAELLLQAARIYEQLGRTKEARAALERLVLGYDEAPYRCTDIGLRTYRGRFELALVLRRLGHAAHCEQMLREITHTYPFYQPARVELADTLRSLNRGSEAQALLAEAPGNQRQGRHAPVVRPPVPSVRPRPKDRLKVAHLIPSMNLGGMERVVLDLCRYGTEQQTVVSTADGAMRAVFEQQGIEVRIGQDTEQLAGCLTDADVVNVHWLQFLPGLFQAVLTAGRPMVCTLHWQSVLPKLPGLVICVSRRVYDLQKPNQDRRVLIRNGIDTSRFQLRKQRSKETRIIRVCRPEKCAEYFWPAVYQALAACPDAAVTVVGGAEYQTDRIQSLGRRLDVDQLLSECSIFANAPRPWEGGLDLVVLEAMASGLPCVLSDSPCVNEAVEHEVTGLLAPFQDVAAFSASLERLIRDCELRQTMGRRAAQVARERFDVRDRVPLYSAAYERALDEFLLPSQLPDWRKRYPDRPAEYLMTYA